MTISGYIVSGFGSFVGVNCVSSGFRFVPGRSNHGRPLGLRGVQGLRRPA